jgi:hypothetical protein
MWIWDLRKHERTWFVYVLYKLPLLIELYLILNNQALRNVVMRLQVNIAVGTSPTTHRGLPSIFPFTLTIFAFVIRRLGGLLFYDFMKTKMRMCVLTRLNLLTVPSSSPIAREPTSASHYLKNSKQELDSNKANSSLESTITVHYHPVFLIYLLLFRISRCYKNPFS